MNRPLTLRGNLLLIRVPLYPQREQQLDRDPELQMPYVIILQGSTSSRISLPSLAEHHPPTVQSAIED
ncbi:hypothetical protein Tco_0478192 [Tanacetum coccineum]